MTSWIGRWPPCACCTIRRGRCTAAGRGGQHTDYGNLTLLANDAAGGLEVRTRGGEWVAAPSIEGAFVCNIGDCLMRWTNDVYVSTPHRVVSPPGRERYPSRSSSIPIRTPWSRCCRTAPGPGGSERYAPIVAAEYLRSRLDPTYARAMP